MHAARTAQRASDAEPLVEPALRGSVIAPMSIFMSMPMSVSVLSAMAQSLVSNTTCLIPVMRTVIPISMQSTMLPAPRLKIPATRSLMPRRLRIQMACTRRLPAARHPTIRAITPVPEAINPNKLCTRRLGALIKNRRRWHARGNRHTPLNRVVSLRHCQTCGYRTHNADACQQSHHPISHHLLPKIVCR